MISRSVLEAEAALIHTFKCYVWKMKVKGDNTTSKKEALIERWGLKKKVEEWQEVRFKRALISMLLKHGVTAKEARKIYACVYQKASLSRGLIL